MVQECCNGMVKILESRLLWCATFRLVYRNQHFGRACCLHIQSRWRQKFFM